MINPTIELVYINGILWLTAEPIIYDINQYQQVIIPKNFITDLASVPQIFWNVLPPQGGKYGVAAVVHDYLYHYAQVYNIISHNYEVITKDFADNVLFQIMSEDNVNTIHKYLIYYAVKFFGSSAWNNWRTYMASKNHSDSPNEWIYTKLGLNFKSLGLNNLIKG